MTYKYRFVGERVWKETEIVMEVFDQAKTRWLFEDITEAMVEFSIGCCYMTIEETEYIRTTAIMLAEILEDMYYNHLQQVEIEATYEEE